MRESNGSLSFTADKLHELVQTKPTQRNLLRAASSIFDQIGISATITIWLRKIQQEKEEKEWNGTTKLHVKRNNYTEFFEILDKRNDLQTVEIPRHYFGYIAFHAFSNVFFSIQAAVAHFV